MPFRRRKLKNFLVSLDLFVNKNERIVEKSQRQAKCLPYGR